MNSSDQRKVLITGSLGNLGRRLSSSLPFRIISTHYKPTPNTLLLDVTDKNTSLNIFEKFKPDVVINSAALTNLEFCQKHPRRAFQVNAHPLAYISNWIKHNNSYLIHISTANVFPGTKKSYKETDITRSVNTYGRSKIQAEKYIHQSGCKYTIIRSGWMVPSDFNTDKKFIGQILKLATTRKKLHIVADKSGSLTCVDDLVNITQKLISKPMYGTFHLAHDQPVNRFQLAKYIFTKLKLNIKLIPVESSFFKASFPVDRPKYEVIESTHAKFNQISASNTTWHQHIDDKINQIKNTGI